MAISTNGTVLARVAGALYNTQLSNATYQEVAAIVTTSASLNALVNDLYARDFATTTDLTVAQTLVSNLGLSSVAGLDNWIAAQITAAGAANKGAKIVELLNSFAQMTSDATYGSAATAFNTKTDASLTLSQTTGNTGGTFAAAGTAAVAGVTFTLTTGTNTVTGGAGNDTINAPWDTTLSAATYSSIDQIAGGAGLDRLYVENRTATPSFALVTGVETLSINQTTTANTGTTLPTDGAFTYLESSGSSVDLKFTGIKNAAVDVGLVGTTAGTVTVDYATTALTGTTDQLDVTLNSAAGGLTISGGDLVSKGLETVAINTVADSTIALDLGGNSVAKLTISGAGITNLSTLSESGSNLKTIDASASTGAVKFSVPVAGSTVTGGSGADTITGSSGNDTISTGAGADSVNSGAGNDNINLGDGNDTYTTTAAATDITKDDTIVGGEGTDVLKLTGAIAYTAASGSTPVANSGSGVSGFETINVAGAVGSSTVPMNMLALSANNTIATISNAGAAGYFTGDTTVATLSFTGSGTTSIASAGAQTISLAPTSGVVAATVTTKATSLTINSAGDDSAGTTNNTVTLTGTAATKLTFTGSENVNLAAGSTSVAVTAIDGSAFTGTKLTVTATSATGAITVTPGGTSMYVGTGLGADTITLTAGADSVSSGAGADTITAGAGNDTISSGAGADVIYAGEGDDSVTSGADAAMIDLGDGNDTVSDAGDGADTLLGGAGDDNLTGGLGNDSIVGGAGNDTLADGVGDDVVSGGDGDDTLNITTGTDNVTGGAGNDTITITGLSLSDTIDGGDGTDSLAVTNSSSVTSRPVVTSIESMSILTSTSLNVNFADLSDSLLTAISVSASDAAAVTLSSLKTGTTVTIADDISSDNTTTADTDNNGNVSAVTLDTLANATLTLSIGANIDSRSSSSTGLGNTGSTLGALTVTDASTVRINSTGGLSGQAITNTTDNIVLDDADTTSLTITASDYSGFTGGDITSAAALETLTVSAGAGASSSIGTIITNTAMSTMTFSATGADSVLGVGLTGGTTKSTALSTVSLTASTGGALTVANIVADPLSTMSSINVTTTGTGSSVNPGDANQFNGIGVETIGFNIGSNTTLYAGGWSLDNAGVTTTATVAALNITVGDDATINATDVLGVDTITALTVNFGSRNTYTGDFNVAAATAITAASFTFAGSTAISFASDAVTYTSGGAALAVDQSGIVATTITASSMTGALTYTAEGAATVTAGSGADVLTAGSTAVSFTAGAGNDTLVGGAAADTLIGGTGADSIRGGNGVDSMTGGDGADVFFFDSDDSATAGSTFTAQTTISTTSLDKITDFAAGDTIRFDTVSLGLTAGTNGTAANGKFFYVQGYYNSTDATFITTTYSTTTLGTVTTLTGTTAAGSTANATMLVYDTDGTSGTAYHGIVLVGYLDTGVASDSLSGTPTGLVGTGT
jgi:Ca2+-binding RTX toxin-like protein